MQLAMMAIKRMIYNSLTRVRKRRMDFISHWYAALCIVRLSGKREQNILSNHVRRAIGIVISIRFVMTIIPYIHLNLPN
jgi:hypothetical protein